MSTSGIRAGDLVLCDIKGRVFHAEITGIEESGDVNRRRTFSIRPIAPNVTYRHCKSVEIRKHWRASRRGT